MLASADVTAVTGEPLALPPGPGTVVDASRGQRRLTVLRTSRRWRRRSQRDMVSSSKLTNLTKTLHNERLIR